MEPANRNRSSSSSSSSPTPRRGSGGVVGMQQQLQQQHDDDDEEEEEKKEDEHQQQQHQVAVVQSGSSSSIALEQLQHNKNSLLTCVDSNSNYYDFPQVQTTKINSNIRKGAFEESCIGGGTTSSSSSSNQTSSKGKRKRVRFQLENDATEIDPCTGVAPSHYYNNNDDNDNTRRKRKKRRRGQRNSKTHYPRRYNNNNSNKSWAQRNFWTLFLSAWLIVFVLLVIVPLAVVLPPWDTSSENTNDELDRNASGTTITITTTTITGSTNITNITAGGHTTSPTGDHAQAPSSSSSSKICFRSTEELMNAVDSYLDEDPDKQVYISLKYGPINEWCFSSLSQITNLTALFSAERNPSTAYFNENIDQWNVSTIIHLNELFRGAIKFNQPLNNWDVSKVEDTSHMFRGAKSFNQGISSWNVSSVIKMRQMFYNATSFNQDLSNWNISHAKDMRGLFRYAKRYRQNLCSWGNILRYESTNNSNNLVDVKNMFHGTNCRLEQDPILSLDPPQPFCSVCISANQEVGN